MFPLAAIPWRLIGAGALVAAFMLMGWRVHAWHEAYKALPGVQAALKAEEACSPDSHCAERQRALEARQEAVSQEVADEYEAEIARLRNQPPVTRVIRVCRATNPGDLRDAQPAGGTDAAGAAGGVILGTDEFSTQPLRDLAREADEVSARLRALQGFNRALGQQPKQ